jgi:hypothetical protein
MSHPPLPVYVINLDHRSDRWESIKKMCYSCGITPERVSAVKESPGWIGCAKSHIKVAELAESKNEPWYLVLEDDASLLQEDWKRCAALLPQLWNMRDQWEIFNGGPGNAQLGKMLSYNPILVEARGSLTHFLIVNSNAYQKIKSWNPEKRAIDLFLAYDIRVNMITTYPLISSQIESISDIGGSGDAHSDFNTSQEAVKTHLLSMKVIEGFTRGFRVNL